MRAVCPQLPPTLRFNAAASLSALLCHQCPGPGQPLLPLMLRRVRLWLEKGLRVKIVTARAGDPEGLAATQAWLKIHGLPELEVTDKKDFGMIELWDDRAIQVVQNTGVCFLGTSYFARPKAPILPDEIADRTFILVGSESKGASPGTKHSA